MTAPIEFVCERCGTVLDPYATACFQCGRLVYAQRLEQLAAAAQAAEATDPSAALAAWREALTLLPPDSRQYGVIVARIEQLGRVATAGPIARGGGQGTGSKLAAGLGTLGLLALKFKWLLYGLLKLPTLLSMVLYFGVYWQLFGWKFALGLVLSIYVHEMGHVIALRRLGFKATAPMFIPGLGALIRLQQQVTNPREDAEIGLAGPIYGLGAAVACMVGYFATGWPTLAVIAGVGAWVNLFNLLPFWTLDGGRGFHAMSRAQRFLAAGAVAAAWLATVMYSQYRTGVDDLGGGEGLLILIGILCVYKAVTDRSGYEGSWKATATYVSLIFALTAVSMMRYAVGGM